MATPAQGGPGSSFAAGWNLLTSDPIGFLKELNPLSDSGAAPASIKQAATTPAPIPVQNFGAGFSELESDPIMFAGDTATVVTQAASNAVKPLLDLPTWAKVAIIGTIVVVGIGATGFVIHSVKNI